MDRLANTSLVGGERLDGTDHCLAGIVRLSNEVMDASSYIPAHDQRIYAEVRFGRVALLNIVMDIGPNFFFSPRLSKPCRTD
jgi:tubulin-specific chaperone C